VPIHDVAFARDPHERRLAQAGVPREFWHLGVKQIHFATLTAWGRKVAPAEQRFWLKALIREPRRELVVIGSPYEELPGLALAFITAMEFGRQGNEYNKTHRVVDTDTQFLPLPYLKMPEVLILHNLIDNAPDERIMRVRDTLLRFRGAVRIVVVAGTRDPWSWSMSKLLLRPDICVVTTGIKAA
jgi:hypothetical protein